MSLATDNPDLFNHLTEHPNLRVVECYLRLRDLEFHTLWNVSTRLHASGYSEEEIAEAMKIYMKF